MSSNISPPTSSRAEFSGKLLSAKHKKKTVENDAQLLQNRIALLKKEESRAWRKINLTKQRAVEISRMRQEHDHRCEERTMLVRKEREREKLQKEENIRKDEEARRARAIKMEDIFRSKRSQVEEVRQQRQENRAEVKLQQQQLIQMKQEKRALIKEHEDELRLMREQSKKELEEKNEAAYLNRVKREHTIAKRRERQVQKMEKMEMQLIQKLKNTQDIQQKAFQELDGALNGEL